MFSFHGICHRSNVAFPSCSYDTLCRHERTLSKDVDGFASRLETWDRSEGSPEALPARTRSAPAGGRIQSEKGGGSLLPEVEEYDEFVGRTGVTGGWDPVDHKRFLRILAEHGVRRIRVSRSLGRTLIGEGW